ncbi:MAG: hypothetical protein RMJ83_07315 [Armatimonadota bacterium]|nr:hypothetical protein [Armatimonadota bacterium]
MAMVSAGARLVRTGKQQVQLLATQTLFGAAWFVSSENKVFWL